jgi:hypothetical protein
MSPLLASMPLPYGPNEERLLNRYRPRVFHFHRKNANTPSRIAAESPPITPATVPAADFPCLGLLSVSPLFPVNSDPSDTSDGALVGGGGGLVLEVVLVINTVANVFKCSGAERSGSGVGVGSGSGVGSGCGVGVGSLDIGVGVGRDARDDWFAGGGVGDPPGAVGEPPGGLAAAVAGVRGLAPSVFCWAGVKADDPWFWFAGVGDGRLEVVFGVGLVCGVVVAGVGVSVKEPTPNVAGGVAIVSSIRSVYEACRLCAFPKAATSSTDW